MACVQDDEHLAGGLSAHLPADDAVAPDRFSYDEISLIGRSGMGHRSAKLAAIWALPQSRCRRAFSGSERRRIHRKTRLSVPVDGPGSSKVRESPNTGEVNRGPASTSPQTRLPHAAILVI